METKEELIEFYKKEMARLQCMNEGLLEICRLQGAEVIELKKVNDMHETLREMRKERLDSYRGVV